MLTRPKVIVPDQNGRRPPSPFSVSSLLLVLLLLVLLGSAFSFLQPGNTLLKRTVQCTRLAFRLHRRKSRRVTFRLSLYELEESLAILILVIGRIKFSFEQTDQVLGHRDLFL